ncbi:phosphatase PAP2 family protein [Salibacteraceae bacterium]|nr:phosphatase PAP2 family protein [Salibacteraceae bacterium]MDB0058131.1 phosphatase PAP2 family protein [Salibacteraceae bacterium]MDC1205027.1 phosphatase PAP2 family protein [Salibacteraceae bacterium]
MFEYLEQLDVQLFLFLNGIHTNFWDVIMFWFSEEITWVPLYAVLLFGLYKKYGWKGLLPVVLGVTLTITLTDQLSVKAFKEVFLRYRPCHNLEIQHLVHLVINHCGGQYGFVSSHASNTFGLASFLCLLFSNKKLGLGLFIWALAVAYSRIYLGVHYPADILAGALLGVLIGTLTGNITGWAIKKLA